MRILFLIIILFTTLNIAASNQVIDMSKRNVFNSFYGKHLLPKMFESMVTAVSYDEAYTLLIGSSEEYITLKLSGVDYKYFSLNYDDVSSWRFREVTGLLNDESGNVILTEDGQAIIIE